MVISQKFLIKIIIDWLIKYILTLNLFLYVDSDLFN